MAWPLSIRTSYTAGALPAIKAADLNAIQEAIVGICTGTLSVKALDVDGTGGAASTVLAGTIHLGTAFTGTTAPTPVVPAGSLTGAGAPLGYAYVASGGTLVRGLNVESTSRVGAGYYEVVFNATPADPLTSCAVATPRQVLTPAYATALAFDSGGKQAVRVAVWDKNGAAFDSNFYVTVSGE